MDKTVSLCDLSPGEKCSVVSASAKKDLFRRLLDIGFTENTVIECLGRAASGDPTAYLVRGAVIALRQEDSGGILVERL